MAGGIIIVAVLVLGLLTLGLVIGGLVLNRRHRREDEARATDRVNGP